MKHFFVNLISKKSIIFLFLYVGMGQLVAQNNLPTVKTPVSPVAASFMTFSFKSVIIFCRR